ncbi:MAG: class I SAM-dependent methyltransferase [Planctomycetota bacterium]|jgi:2-polyprenyl-3-methyl-5-hydroxy-6-metoxy-1,4-benzoquinol methylase
MMSPEQIQRIREHELRTILPELPKGCSILEIGAGTGGQAKLLSEEGYSVKAIDIKTSQHAQKLVWPVTIYDGKVIPFQNESFDIVFSSNVLEHISHVNTFQNEIKRVLKPCGTAIHFLPSGSWRFCTIVTHYIYISKLILLIINLGVFHKNQRIKMLALKMKLKKSFFPSRHGTRGNAVSEIFYFSRFYWSNLFTKTGWTITKHTFNNLIYTGYSVFDTRLSIRYRKILSFFLGSSCHTYMLIR